MTKPKFEVAVGFFVVVGFLIFSVIVFFVSGIYFFRPGYHLTALFDFVGIIGPGAPVRYSGVRVGEVSEVKIVKPSAETQKTKVEVTFFLEKGVEIREHDEVGIQGTHIMSEPHIQIIPAAQGGRILKDGEVIPNGVSPTSMDDLIRQGESIATRFDHVLRNVSDALEEPETRRMLRDSLANLNQVLASLNAITAGQEQEFRTLVTNLGEVAGQMGELIRRINQGEGTMGKLISDDELYNDLVSFTGEIKKHPWKLFKKG